MEQLIKNIVVGYDFSKQSNEALGSALALARKVGAKVKVVTALPGHVDPEVIREAKAEATPTHDQLYDVEALMSAVQGRMDDMVKAFGVEDVDVVCEVSQRKATDAIFDEADLFNADLIIVGATGQSALQRLLVGSTSAQLVRRSRWPVMVIQPGMTFPPKRILCPVDFSSASRRALGWAGELAGLFGAHVDVLHVRITLPRQWMDIYGENLAPGMVKAMEEETRALFERLDEFCDIEDLKDVSWEPVVLQGQPEEVILEVAANRGTDMVCMGSVGRGGVEGFLMGNTAERVLRQLPCSLLAAKPDDFAVQLDL